MTTVRKVRTADLDPDKFSQKFIDYTDKNHYIPEYVYVRCDENGNFDMRKKASGEEYRIYPIEK